MSGSMASRELLLFGAGNIGLSFVAQIFRRAGYRVVCADTDTTVLHRLEVHGGYRVNLLSPDGTVERLPIEGIEVVDATDRRGLAERLSRRPIIATAVGAGAFPHVLGAIRDAADGVVPVSCLDVIAAENIHDPAGIARDRLGAAAPRIHACSVGKMVPVQDTGESGAVELRCEAYNTLICDGRNWGGEPPTDVPWIRLVENITAWMDRKLFVHNLGHSACAWRARAYDPAIATIAEAIGEPAIRAHAARVMRAAAAVVARAHPGEFETPALEEHVADLITRFGNAQLGDTVERVGRDLPRKLGRDERLVGALRLAAQHQASDALVALAPVARDALAFGVPGVSAHPADVEVSTRAASRGSSRTIGEIAGLSHDKPVDRTVLEALQGK